MMASVALFVRVSSKDQSHDRQVSELTEYSTSQGWKVAAIIEEKISGRKTPLEKRQSLKDLFKLIEAEAIQKVIISEVTRLGRRTKDILEVIEQLHQHKVSLVVYNYRLETLDHKGRVNSLAQFLITILGDVGRMETETLSERTKSGLEEAKRKGKRLGRPEGLIKESSDYLKEYPGVVKDLKAGLSIRQIVATRQVADKTVQKVKKAMADTT
jgi:DNA invertase Pin-like site-specific DNA recombinase